RHPERLDRVSIERAHRRRADQGPDARAQGVFHGTGAYRMAPRAPAGGAARHRREDCARLYLSHSSRCSGLLPGRRDPGEGRRSSAEAMSSRLREAPSPGLLGSDGIERRRARRPRMDKREREGRPRGSRKPPSKRRAAMRYVGIDIGSETHVVAVVDAEEQVLLRPCSFAESAEGYARLFERLGEPADTLVAMEATGHYWKNLFAALAVRGFPVALLNPLRTR